MCEGAYFVISKALLCEIYEACVESSFVRYFFICSLSSLTGILGCLDLFDTDWDSGMNRDDTIYLLSLSCWYSVATRETLIT